MLCPTCHGSGQIPVRSTYVAPSERAHVPSEYLVNDWRVRMEQGRKGSQDTKIKVATPGGELSTLSLSSLGSVVSLWYRNEDRLYPTGCGGRIVLAFLEATCQAGVRSASRLYDLPQPKIERME